MARKKQPLPKKSSRSYVYVQNSNGRRNEKWYKWSRSTFKDVKKLQSTTAFCIPKLPVRRLVRELLQQFHMELRVSAIAVQALQEAAEMYCVQLFEDSNLAARHAKRVTVSPLDIRLCLVLRKED